MDTRSVDNRPTADREAGPPHKSQRQNPESGVESTTSVSRVASCQPKTCRSALPPIIPKNMQLGAVGPATRVAPTAGTAVGDIRLNGQASPNKPNELKMLFINQVQEFQEGQTQLIYLPCYQSDTAKNGAFFGKNKWLRSIKDLESGLRAGLPVSKDGGLKSESRLESTISTFAVPDTRTRKCSLALVRLSPRTERWATFPCRDKQLQTNPMGLRSTVSIRYRNSKKNKPNRPIFHTTSRIQPEIGPFLEKINGYDLLRIWEVVAQACQFEEWATTARVSAILHGAL